MKEYKIKKHANGWVIERPDGSIVNETVYKDRRMAERHIELLRQLRYCK